MMLSITSYTHAAFRAVGRKYAFEKRMLTESMSLLMSLLKRLPGLMSSQKWKVVVVLEPV